MGEAEALKNSDSEAIGDELRHILAVELGAVAWEFCPGSEDHKHSWIAQTRDMTSFGFVVICANCRWAGQAEVPDEGQRLAWRPKKWSGRMKRDYRRLKKAGVWQFCPRRGMDQKLHYPQLGNHVYRVVDNTTACCEFCDQPVPLIVNNHPWPQSKVRAVRGAQTLGGMRDQAMKAVEASK